jgi:hypothetical protein
MLSIGLWRWYINIIITILDIVHRPVFYLKGTTFRNMDLFPPSGEGKERLLGLLEIANLQQNPMIEVSPF